MNKISAEDEVRELSPAELNKVGGGFLEMNFNNSNVAIGQVNYAETHMGRKGSPLAILLDHFVRFSCIR